MDIFMTKTIIYRYVCTICGNIIYSPVDLGDKKCSACNSGESMSSTYKQACNGMDDSGD